MLNRSCPLGVLLFVLLIDIVFGAPGIRASDENGAGIPGTGLEVGDARKLLVVFEELSDDAKKLGLTKGLLEARVLQKVRSAGIIPLGEEAYNPEGCLLYVRITVVGFGFSINTEFCRPVLYYAKGTARRTLGTVWHTGAAGTGKDKQFILQGATEQIETFCNEFLKANGG